MPEQSYVTVIASGERDRNKQLEKSRNLKCYGN